MIRPNRIPHIGCLEKDRRQKSFTVYLVLTCVDTLSLSIKELIDTYRL